MEVDSIDIPNDLKRPLLDEIEYPNKKPNETNIDYEDRQLISKMDNDPSKSVKVIENTRVNNASAGVLMGLVAKGVQDVYMTNNPSLFDARKQFLTGIHQFSYQQISVRVSCKYKKVSYILHKVCDLVNRLDLVIPNPNNLPLNKIIKTIETEVGGKILDKISGDIDTIIKTDCELFKRKLTHINGKTFVPLNLAPLYDHNMIQPSYEIDEFKINIEYRQEYEFINNVEIYGNIYFLDTLERRCLFDNSHEFLTIQHQYTGLERLCCGHTGFRLIFNHPVYLIYFWGFDKSKVKNIKLQLNGHNFYDGPIDALEHYKLSRGYNVEPVVIFFSQDDFDKPTKCTLNFSRIDYAQIYILSDQRENTDVHFVALNYQPFRYTNGMCNIAYTN